MADNRGNHPLAGVPGVFALVVWSVYVLYVAFNYDAALASAIIGCVFGLVACVAMILNFRYWRYAVLLASAAYLLLYVIRIVRMTTMTADVPFLPALSLYYGMSWAVTTGVSQEKGMAAALAHGYFEFVMPVLVIAIIAAVLVPGAATPSRRNASAQ